MISALIDWGSFSGTLEVELWNTVQLGAVLEVGASVAPGMKQALMHPVIGAAESWCPERKMKPMCRENREKAYSKRE